MGHRSHGWGQWGPKNSIPILIEVLIVGIFVLFKGQHCRWIMEREKERESWAVVNRRGAWLKSFLFFFFLPSSPGFCYQAYSPPRRGLSPILCMQPPLLLLVSFSPLSVNLQRICPLGALKSSLSLPDRSVSRARAAFSSSPERLISVEEFGCEIGRNCWLDRGCWTKKQGWRRSGAWTLLVEPLHRMASGRRGGGWNRADSRTSATSAGIKLSLFSSLFLWSESVITMLCLIFFFSVLGISDKLSYPWGSFWRCFLFLIFWIWCKVWIWDVGTWFFWSCGSEVDDLHLFCCSVCWP